MATTVSKVSSVLANTVDKVSDDISNADTVSIQIFGTFVGTWLVETSMDDTNWFPFSMKRSASSDFTVESNSLTFSTFLYKNCTGLRFIRVSFTALTSGSASVVIRATIQDK